MRAEESDESWVCADCIGDEFLRHRTEKEGRLQTCHYCEEIHSCFTLETVCDLTDKAVQAHFYRAPAEPNEMEYASLRHLDGYEWFRDGEDVVQLNENLLQTRREPADDIQQLLEYRLSEFDSDVMGLETKFSRESCYFERRQISTGRLDSMWINIVS